MTKFAASLLAFAGALSLAGCGGGGDAGESASTATAVATQVGATALGVSVSTKDLPDFVVLPDGAVPLQRMQVNDDGHDGGMVSVETGMTTPELIAFYKKVMADKGLKQSMETASPDGATLSGASDEQARVLTVILSQGENGKTVATLTYAEKKG